MNLPVGAGDGLGTGPLNGIDNRQDDTLMPQAFDKCTGQNSAFIGLQSQIGQHIHRLPVMTHGERLEAEHGLQLNKVLSSRQFTLTIFVPTFDWDIELHRHHVQ